MDATDVSLIVPVGGAAPGWDRCSRSLAALDRPPGELIVVLDGADDALARHARKIGAEVVVLERQGGPARARNRGASRATGEILLFVDSDVELPPETVDRVAALFPRAGAPTAIFGSYDDDPAEPGTVSRFRNLLHHFVHQRSREEASTFWAGCGAVRRHAFDDLGGFDEGFDVPSIEDIELGSRLRRAGHSIRLVKELRVKHLKRWTFGGFLATDLWCRAVPWTELMLRGDGLLNDLNVRFVDRLNVLLAFVPLVLLPAALRWPALLPVGAAAVLLIVPLNGAFFGFLRRTGGLGFAVRSLLLFWAHLLTCGLGFGVGLLRSLARRPGPGAGAAPDPDR